MIENVVACLEPIEFFSIARVSMAILAHSVGRYVRLSRIRSLDLMMAYCAVLRVYHHRQNQVIPPLPRLAGPPVPSYRWINEMGYGRPACIHALAIVTVHVSAPA